MNRRGTPGALDKGDIVDFHFLHLDQIPWWELNRAGPDSAGNYIYSIKGKPRPMLVLGKIRDGFEGVVWYKVLKLTTKKDYRSWNKHYEEVGDVMKNGKQSYTDWIIHAYPDNLAVSIQHRVDPLTLAYVLNKVSRLMLGSPPAST